MAFAKLITCFVVIFIASSNKADDIASPEAFDEIHLGILNTHHRINKRGNQEPEIHLSSKSSPISESCLRPKRKVGDRIFPPGTRQNDPVAYYHYKREDTNSQPSVRQGGRTIPIQIPPPPQQSYVPSYNQEVQLLSSPDQSRPLYRQYSHGYPPRPPPALPGRM